MLHTVLQLVKTAVRDWQTHRAPRLGAALAFYTVFSLAPLLVIAISIAGAVFGDAAARGKISTEMQGTLGDNAAAAIEDMIQHVAHDRHRGHMATIVGIVVLVFGAAGVFGQLKDALNTIWDVEPKPGHAVRLFVWDYLISFSMVACIAFLLLVSLLFTAIVGGASQRISYLVNVPPAVFGWLDWTIALALTTLLFALLFKVLPDAKIGWRQVWIGALITAVLFTAGKALLGFYFGKMATASAYGAAGSLITVLLWVYYSSQILLFGAELTQAYACEFGDGIIPADYAQRIPGRSDPCAANHQSA